MLPMRQKLMGSICGTAAGAAVLALTLLMPVTIRAARSSTTPLRARMILRDSTLQAGPGAEPMSISLRRVDGSLAAEIEPWSLLRLRGGQDAEDTGAGYDEISIDVLTDMGREAIGEKKYSEAADYLSAALARKVEQKGELATECAELYYLYGSALALEAEETDDALFGPSVPAQLPVGGTNATAASVEEEEGEEEEEEGEDEYEDEDGGDGEGEEEEEHAGENGRAQSEEDQRHFEQDNESDGEQVEGDRGLQAESGAGSAAADRTADKSVETLCNETLKGEAAGYAIPANGSAGNETQSAHDDPRESAWQVLDIARVILENSIQDSQVTLSSPSKRDAHNSLISFTCSGLLPSPANRLPIAAGPHQKAAAHALGRVHAAGRPQSLQRVLQ